MKQKTLAAALKCAALLVALIGAAVFFWLIPQIGLEMAAVLSEDPVYNARVYWAYQIPIWLCTVPIVLSLGLFWGICTRIGQDRSFSHENARALTRITWLAMLDTGLSILFTLILAATVPMHPFPLIVEAMIVATGVIVTVVAACLSRLVEKAACMKDENDLTI